MKKCAHCKEFKHLDEYAYSNKILKRRQKHCRDCMRKFNRQSYLRRSEKKKQQVAEDKVNRRAEAKQFIWDYLTTRSCVDCGESDPRVLEFDHVRGKKVDAISNLPNRGFSLDRIQKEIRKCEVRCSNCHRRKTHKERGWFSG